MTVPGYLEWLDMRIAGNELWRLALFFLLVLAALLVGRIARYLLQREAGRHDARRVILTALLRSLAKSVGLILLAAGLYAGLSLLTIPPKLLDPLKTATGILFTISVAWFAYHVVGVADAWITLLASRTKSKMDDMLVPLVRTSLRIFVVVLAVLQVATQLSDKPVTSLLAGLGVGGLALALAAQETVKNFFGSLMIFADKPFEMGDRIVVDDFDGPVESVGFRSTRIRTLDGHLVTIPNGELANKPILNIGRRPHIRRIMNLSVTYDTTPGKMREALQIVKDVLKDHEGLHADFPPRVFFNDFKDAWLGIMVIYWYHPADYWAFMAFSERVNLEILGRFNEAGIEFAFPTQTIHLAQPAPGAIQLPDPSAPPAAP